MKIHQIIVLFVFVSTSVLGQSRPRVVESASSVSSIRPSTTEPFIQVIDRGGYIWKYVAGSSDTNPPNFYATNGAWIIQDWNDGNVKAYGVVGNGVADDTLLLQTAIGSKRPLLIPEGMTPKITSYLLSTNPLTKISGYGAKIITTNASYFLVVSNVYNSTFYALSSNALIGQPCIGTLNTNQFSIGDYIKVRDDQWRDTNTAAGGNIDLNRVRSIGPGFINLEYSLTASFLTASNASVGRINPLEVDIEGLSVESQTISNHSGGIRVVEGTMVNIKDFRCTSMYNPGVHVYRSTHVLIEGGNFERSQSYSLGGIGYGVSIGDSTHRFRVTGVHSGFIREHSMWGGVRFGKVDHCRMNNHYDDGVNTHGNGCFNIEFADNDIIYPRTLGINVSFSTAHKEDRNVWIHDNRIWSNGRCILVECPVSVGSTNEQVVINDNWMSSATGAAIAFTTPNVGVVVNNNYFIASSQDASSYGIQVTYGRLTAKNNWFSEYYSTPILLQDGSSDCLIEGNAFEDNFGTMQSTYVVYLGGARHTVKRNTFRGFGKIGIRSPQSSRDHLIEGNEFSFFTDPAQPCVYIEGSNHKLVRNSFHDTPNKGIDTSSLTTNVFIDGIFGARMTNTLLALIGGNYTINDFNAESLSGSALTLSSVNGINGTKFTFRNTTNGLNIANSSNVNLSLIDFKFPNTTEQTVGATITAGSNIVLNLLRFDASLLSASTNLSTCILMQTSPQDVSIRSIDAYPMGWLDYAIVAAGKRTRISGGMLKDFVTNVGPFRVISITTGSDDLIIDGMTIQNSGQAYGIRADGTGNGMIVRNCVFGGLASTDVSTAGIWSNVVVEGNAFLDSANDSEALGFAAGSSYTSSRNTYSRNPGPLMLGNMNPTNVIVPIGGAALYLARNGTNQVLAVRWENQTTNQVAIEP